MIHILNIFSLHIRLTSLRNTKSHFLQRYPAKNLLNSSAGSSWKCKDPGEKQAAIILELEESCVIQSIDIGNENSAFVEIFVGKSVMPDCFEVIIIILIRMYV